MSTIDDQRSTTTAGGSASDSPGWSVVELLDDHLLIALRELYESLSLDPAHAFVATSNDLPRADARRVHDRIVEILGDRLAEVAPGHRVFLAGFISKGAEIGGPTAFHQDLSYTDERHERATLLWSPLVDVDESSGALQVVSGSHRWSAGVRPSGLSELPTAALQSELADVAVTVPLAAGQAVRYDPALIHGAHTNTVGVARPALAIALVPDEVQLVHVHSDPDGHSLTAYLVDAEYHVDQGLFHRPVGRDTTAVWGEPVTEQELRAALERTTGTHGDGVDHDVNETTYAARRSGRTADIDDREQNGTTTPQVLVDPKRDAELQRDGVTVMPFVDPGTVSRLRGIYAVHHGWDGAGFEPDLNNPDTEYRHAVSAEIAKVLEDRTTALFVRHVPFLRVFLCKWPGDDSDLYIHRDWMYTDERQGARTYVVWVALQDITEENGPLQVVKGTHRLDPMLRGTDLNPSWLEHQEVLSDHLVQVTARAGDALIFDNQLIHASPPNLTDEPRLVTAVGMRDRDAPLVYFRRRDEHHADRYDVDEEFFLTETPGGLFQTPPDLDVVETVPVTGQDLDADQLTAVLDRDRLRRPVDRVLDRLPIGRAPVDRLRRSLLRARG